MKATDVMVTNVITVGPEASVQDVARILLGARISGVPVVGSKGELLEKENCFVIGEIYIVKSNNGWPINRPISKGTNHVTDRFLFGMFACFR